MPILGSASAGAGQVKPGVYLPTGWNTNWLAARNNHASARTEVCIFGDSTTFGSATGTIHVLLVGAEGPRPVHRRRLHRRRARHRRHADTAALSGPENIPIVQSTSGGTWASSGDGNDVLLTETPTSTVNGATIVFQGYGTAARLTTRRWAPPGRSPTRSTAAPRPASTPTAAASPETRST
jgi:hypothetical protein